MKTRRLPLGSLLSVTSITTFITLIQASITFCLLLRCNHSSTNNSTSDQQAFWRTRDWWYWWHSDEEKGKTSRFWMVRRPCTITAHPYLFSLPLTLPHLYWATATSPHYFDQRILHQRASNQFTQFTYRSLLEWFYNFCTQSRLPFPALNLPLL